MEGKGSRVSLHGNIGVFSSVCLSLCLCSVCAQIPPQAASGVIGPEKDRSNGARGRNAPIEASGPGRGRALRRTYLRRYNSHLEVHRSRSRG